MLSSIVRSYTSLCGRAVLPATARAVGRRVFVRLVLGLMVLMPGPVFAQVVTPDGAATSAPANATGRTAGFTVRNDQETQETFDLACSRTGTVSSCSVQSFVTLHSGQSTTVNVTYATGAAGPGTLTLEASGTGFDDGWYNVTVTAARSAPVVSLAPHNGDNRNAALCAIGCFDATAAYATPAYVSTDAPRAVTLLYRSGQARPMGLVQVDATDNSSDQATKMSIRLKRPDDSWVTFTTGTQEVFFTRGSGANRLSVQFDATGLVTGAHDYTVVVRSWWADGMLESSAPLRVLIVNENTSPFGWGWSIAGFQRIHVQQGGALVVTEGDGSILYFGPACSGCQHASPLGDFTSVVNRAVIGADSIKYDRMYPDGTKLSFYSDGRLKQAEDRFGNRTTYGYDASNRLTSISDPASLVVTLAYGADGKLDWVKDPAGRYSYVTIDASGNVTDIQDPAGGFALRASYDGNHRMTTRTDRRDGVWGFAYDFAGKLAGDTMPPITADGTPVRPVVQFSSFERGILVDPSSGLGTSANPAPQVVPANIRGRVTNPRGYVTGYQLDRFGAPTRIEEPLGRISTLTRNAHSQVTSTTAPSGHSIGFTWTGVNLTRTHDQTTTQIVDYEYDTRYNILIRVSGNLPEQRWFLDAAGKKVDSARVATDTSTRFFYDALGRLDSIIDPRRHKTSYAYLATGSRNLDVVTAPNGAQQDYGYDAHGRLTSVSMLGVGSAAKTRRWHYDALNRLVGSVSAMTGGVGTLGDTVSYVYDSLYLWRVRDALGQVYQFDRNALGWVTAETDPAGLADGAFYDKNGNLTRAVNRRRQAVTFTYHNLDQMLSRTADGSTTSFYADPLGGFATVANGESTDSLRFDVAGRLDTVITRRGAQKYVLASAYDVRGPRTRFDATSPTGAWTGTKTVRFAYGPRLTLDTLVALDGLKTTWSFNDDFMPTGVSLPTNPALFITRGSPSTHATSEILYNQPDPDAKLTETYAHDGYGRVAETHNVNADTVVRFAFDGVRPGLTAMREYKYVAPVCEEMDAGGGNKWSGVICTPSDTTRLYEELFDYDSTGNRLHPQNFVRDPGNRVRRYGDWRMDYDADGNTVRKYKLDGNNNVVYDQYFYWNSLGQLDSVKTNGALTAFRYDGFGRRVRKTTSSGTARYLHDGDDLFMELADAGTPVAEYTYYPGIDRPHSVRRSGATYYFGTNWRGDVVGLMNGAAAVVNEYRYTAFGESRYASEAGVANQPLRFGARELDLETGLYHNRARYYDPMLSRFVSEDPIGLAGGINPYVYAGNDPVNRRDPSGLAPCGEVPHVDDSHGHTYYDTDRVGGVSGPFDDNVFISHCYPDDPWTTDHAIAHTIWTSFKPWGLTGTISVGPGSSGRWGGDVSKRPVPRDEVAQRRLSTTPMWSGSAYCSAGQVFNRASTAAVEGFAGGYAWGYQGGFRAGMMSGAIVGASVLSWMPGGMVIGGALGSLAGGHLVGTAMAATDAFIGAGMGALVSLGFSAALCMTGSA